MKPAAASRAKRFGLLNFSHAEKRAVKVASRKFATRGRSKLNVIEMYDPRLHGEKNSSKCLNRFQKENKE